MHRHGLCGPKSVAASAALFDATPKVGTEQLGLPTPAKAQAVAVAYKSLSPFPCPHLPERRLLAAAVRWCPLMCLPAWTAGAPAGTGRGGTWLWHPGLMLMKKEVVAVVVAVAIASFGFHTADIPNVVRLGTSYGGACPCLHQSSACCQSHAGALAFLSHGSTDTQVLPKQQSPAGTSPCGKVQQPNNYFTSPRMPATCKAYNPLSRHDPAISCNTDAAHS